MSSGDEEDLGTALRYAANFSTAAGGSRPVDVVVNGPALNLVLANSGWRKEIGELQAGGAVTFGACANTMTARGVAATDLLPAVVVVSAAVLHLAQRQWAGWAYLRP